MWRAFAMLIMLGSAGCALYAQSAEPENAAAEIKALTQEVDELKARVADVNELKTRVAALEAKLAQVEPSAAPPSKPPADVPSAEAEPQSASMGPERISPSVFQGIKIQGFGEASYKASDARPPETQFFGFRHGANNSFALGDVDLFVTSHLTAAASVLGEIDFRENADQVFDVSVERLLLKFDVNDHLKMSFGRFHTYTSYYNSVFHHGKWLQTAADRPLSVEFTSNGGLLPSQALGVSMTGKIPSGKLGLNYIFEYGTSDTVRPNILNPNTPPIDEGNGNGISGGLFVRPDWLQGLELGGSFYHDRLSPSGGETSAGGAAISATAGAIAQDTGEATGPVHIGQSIISVHAVYITPRFEFINEGFLIRHRVQETGEKFNTPSFYTLISQKVGSRWRPYFRYQYAHASAGSPIFPDIGLRHGPSGGIRLDYNNYIAFKAQYDRTYRRDLTTINDIFLQLAFRF
jgi:hypothetical protein